MSLLPLGHDTITWLQRTSSTTDAYGQEVFTETQTVITGCSVQPMTTTETLDDNDLTTGTMKLFAPVGFDFQAVDRILCNGITYELTGYPMPWNDFFGSPDHVEVLLRRAEG